MRALVLLAAVCGTAACGGDTGPSGPNAVAVTNNQFTPPALSVAVSETVTWEFRSGTHNVTFEDNVSNSSNLSSGTHARAFGSAGTYRYRCTLHSTDFTSGMVGTVTVQ
ncbi:MAG: plastocyanin/azurin family copper-binding protein [Gemmatimonadales bacterium]